MHVLELPPAQRDALYSMVSPPIAAIIHLRCQSRQQTGVTAQGVPVFGGYQLHDIDVSARLMSRIRYSSEKPRYPSDEVYLTNSVTVSISLANPDGYIATFQEGGGLKADEVEQGEIRIYADIGTGTPLEMFFGRIEGRPTEKRGSTVITAKGSMYEAIRKPALYENFGTVAGTSQQAAAIGSSFATQAARIECLGHHFCAHHGIVQWDGFGRPRPAFRQSGGTGIALSALSLSNGAKLGRYRIKFNDATNYTITYPDNQTYSGNINQPTFGGVVSIVPDQWIGSDGTGAEIEFAVSWAASGNMVCMAFNALEKALLDNVGDLPNQTPSVRLDVPKWQQMADRFAAFVGFAEITNSDNGVWDRRADRFPASWGDLAQKLLNHLCITMTITSDGLISPISPYVDDTIIWPTHTDSDIVVDSLAIEGGEAFNKLILNYGHDSETNAHAAVHEIDFRPNPSSEIVEVVIAAPFYKIPVSSWEARWLAETVVRRNLQGLRAQTLVRASVTAQHGLPLQLGDRANVASDAAPYFTAICEVVGMGKEIGGVVELSLSPIQQTKEGAAAAACIANVGAVSAW